jgi:membrane fusion protein (multidrug efflux system)
VKGHLPISKLDESKRDLAKSRHKILAIKQELAHVRANLGGRPDIPVGEHPRYREAQAIRDEAELDLRRTLIHAPAAGVITNIGLQVGEFVEAGKPILRVRPETLRRITEFSEHESDGGELEEGERVAVEVFPVPG